MPNYHLLAEWQPQKSVLLTWPHQYSDWAASLSSIEKTYITIASTINRYQHVTVLCYDEAHLAHISTLLSHLDASQLTLLICQTNDTWIRDYGPLSVRDTQDRCQQVEFIFNAWGNKFASDLDNQANQYLNQQTIIQLNDSIPFVLEGGAIDCDGKGTLLATNHCLTHPNRNGVTTKREIEQVLEQLGISRVLWLHHGYLAGDDTDSHVDMLARFVSDKAICYQACTDDNDEHFAALNKMTEELSNFRTLSDEPYQLIALPWPEASYCDDARLPLSYANFLIINGAVLVPQYQVKADIKALEVIQKAFPEREVIGIDCLALVKQGGSLHCATMQIA